LTDGSTLRKIFEFGKHKKFLNKTSLDILNSNPSLILKQVKEKGKKKMQPNTRNTELESVLQFKTGERKKQEENATSHSKESCQMNWPRIGKLTS